MTSWTTTSRAFRRKHPLRKHDRDHVWLAFCLMITNVYNDNFFRFQILRFHFTAPCVLQNNVCCLVGTIIRGGSTSLGKRWC